MSLNALPYDLLFNIAQYLAIDDIHSLQATSRSLRVFTLTRPVYRALAHGLLARSRPLPLPAFQRLSDLSTKSLIRAVDRAHRFERAWRVRAPRPARSPFALSGPTASSDQPEQWYTKISAPPNEEIDWLSPITSSYTLCATKSGRVICWDVARDACLAEWDPRMLSGERGNERVCNDSGREDRRRTRGDGDDYDDDLKDAEAEKKWELWKCRVEFDERAVYFTMARVLEGSYDDNRVMEFVLMKLAFPPEARDHPSPSSKPSSFTPESHSYPLSKSPTSSRSLSPQASSPNDSIVHASSTLTDSNFLSRSPISTRTTSPLPDYAECSRDTSTNGIYAYSATSDQFMSNRACSRTGILFEASFQPMLECKPIFFPLTSFHTTGVVMNVFLLDPPRRLLSAFVWVASSNTIGLYVLLDWAQDEYVFVDTGVGCLISSNWSCILHEDQIVIHSEEADAAYQHFYPLNVLRKFVKPRKPSLLASRIHGHDQENYDPSRKFCRDELPIISIRLSPMRSISKKFVFPTVQPYPAGVPDSGLTTEEIVEDEGVISADDTEEQPEAGPSTPSTAVGASEELNEKDASFEYGSGYVADDDDDGWPQEFSAETPRSKGKRRADSDDEYEQTQTLPATRTKGKGKMREADADHQPNGESSQTRSLSSSHQGSPGTVHSSSSASSTVVQSVAASLPPATLSPAPNPYPFPPWYPESAHFVRQWWPTLPGVPRLSCTVVLLAAHDPDTHRTQFVLAQHYFRVPIVAEPSSSTPILAVSRAHADGNKDGDGDDEMLHLWYVSTPFEVVCVSDTSGENDDEDETGDRPRPLVAVDFGHAVWIENEKTEEERSMDTSQLAGNPPFSDSEDGDDVDEALFATMSDGGSGSTSGAASTSTGDDTGHHCEHGHSAHRYGRSASQSTADSHEGDGAVDDQRAQPTCKRLRFVTFPPVYTAVDKKREKGEHRRTCQSEDVRTLEIPDELDLDGVETINIDQSQGAVILSVKDGKIFILRYE